MDSHSLAEGDLLPAAHLGRTRRRGGLPQELLEGCRDRRGLLWGGVGGLDLQRGSRWVVGIGRPQTTKTLPRRSLCLWNVRGNVVDWAG